MRKISSSYWSRERAPADSLQKSRDIILGAISKYILPTT